jgi:hypothetical protein
MVNAPKKWMAPRSAVFRSSLRHAKIEQHGISFKYQGCRLKGLTGPTGLLRPRFYPYFDRDKAVDVGMTDKGVPLKWSSGAAPGRHPSQRAEAMERRIGRGIARGNALVTGVATMVTMMQRYGVPLQLFSASHRQRRTPKTMTVAWLSKKFAALAGDEPAAKACASIMNSSRPHLGLLAQKLVELELDAIGYEVPVVHPEVGLTAADLVCVHRPTKALVWIELKSGGGAYTFMAHGNLRAPFNAQPNCVFNHHFLQLAYTFDWAKRSYPELAPSFSIPLLLRVSPTGCWHQALPAAFRSPPSLRQ